MPTVHRNAIAFFCGIHSFTIPIIAMLSVFMLVALPINSAQGHSFVPAVPVGEPTREYVYEPISDTMLRSLLGYGAKKERQNIRPIQILLSPRPTNEMSMEGDERANDERIVTAKRNNAELVNHILKNFASLNRLGDAGKK